MVRQRRRLEDLVAYERSEREKEHRVYAELQTRKNVADDENKGLAETVALLNQEIKAIKADSDELMQTLEEQ